MFRKGMFDHVKSDLYISAAASAAGIAQGALGPVPPGYCWYVERMNTKAVTAATGVRLEVFVTATSPLTGYTATVGSRVGRQDLSVTAENDVADENAAIFVGEGYYLVALWTGLQSGDPVTLATQIAVHKEHLYPGPHRHGGVHDLAAAHADEHEPA